ncbi:DUF3303 domain-containing protein [Kordiimonas sp.]|uniref:DUF3303 domain-containing protein n=1 Tax=Kordiimonas sp. TaxID=1970157 RepID=UPI003A94243C
MHFMVIEKFRHGNPQPVFDRYEERGHMLPDGLLLRKGWVTADMRCCYQVMETEDPALITEWIKVWDDLADFEVVRLSATMTPPAVTPA